MVVFLRPFFGVSVSSVFRKAAATSGRFEPASRSRACGKSSSPDQVMWRFVLETRGTRGVSSSQYPVWSRSIVPTHSRAGKVAVSRTLSIVLDRYTVSPTLTPQREPSKTNGIPKTPIVTRGGGAVLGDKVLDGVQDLACEVVHDEVLRLAAAAAAPPHGRRGAADAEGGLCSDLPVLIIAHASRPDISSPRVGRVMVFWNAT